MMGRRQTSPLLALMLVSSLFLLPSLSFAQAPAAPDAKAAAPDAKAAAPDAKPAESKPLPPSGDEDPAPNSGDTAWMLISSALVMLMVPGLALFYAGMVRRKNVLATMMHSMVALAIVGVFWIAVGYALAFGPPLLGTKEASYLGWSSDLLFLKGYSVKKLLPGGTIPLYVHVMFQGMFAIITPALISGAIAERIRFAPYCVFTLLWVAIVYCPLANWVWAMNWWDTVEPGTKAVGWLGVMGALDFAGGTVVHIAAGFSALAAIILLRKRLGYPEHAMHPNSMVLCLTGAGILWFGWFGFNGGSAGASNALASSAFAATQAAAAAAALSWVGAEWLHKGKPTALGLASGLVAGLVAVTPASGYIYVWGGLAIGLIAGVVCYGAVCLKSMFGYDDSLDAFGVHGVGGFLGAVLTGVFCYKAVNAADGLIAGSPGQVTTQVIAAVSAAAYGFLVTLVLVKLVDVTMGFTTDEASETTGLDQTEHGEVGFDFSPALESMSVATNIEPRPATVPPDGGKRFVAVVEGAQNGDLIHTWSALCKPSQGPPSQDFQVVYPYLTTVQGNRFRFRGGDPQQMRASLEKLLRSQMGNPGLRVWLET